jgi:hypothetical protein
MLPFESFRKIFLDNVRSKTFAEESFPEPGAQSPAAKELRKSGADSAFSDNFLRSIHRLLREYFRLVNEQSVVRGIKKKNSAKIIKLGDALRTVQAVRARLKMVEANTRELISWEVWPRVQQALEDCESSVRNIREYWMAEIHPTERDFIFPKVKWELVLKPYNYELATLKKKAPDQWLYETLNARLEEKLKPFKISDMTRYRIMSALLAPDGVNVKAITLKQYFSAQKAAANNLLKNPKTPAPLPKDEFEDEFED